MKIRIRGTGQVMFDSEWREIIKATHQVNIRVIDEETLDKYGADAVFEGAQASGGTVYQYSQYAGVEQLEDGKWYTKYVLGPIFMDKVENGVTITAAEQEAAHKAQMDQAQAAAVRQTRDGMLKDTDWRFRSDMTPSQAWKDYCQALRDVPAQAGFPWNVTWPAKP